MVEPPPARSNLLSPLFALSKCHYWHFGGRDRQIVVANGWSLRELQRTLETPGANRLRAARAALDSAVRTAYGMKENEDPLAFLLRLSLALAEKEANGQPVTPPGLPVPIS